MARLENINDRAEAITWILNIRNSILGSNPTSRIVLITELDRWLDYYGGPTVKNTGSVPSNEKR